MAEEFLTKMKQKRTGGATYFVISETENRTK